MTLPPITGIIELIASKSEPHEEWDASEKCETQVQVARRGKNARLGAENNNTIDVRFCDIWLFFIKISMTALSWPLAVILE